MNDKVLSFKCDLENYKHIKALLNERKQELTEVIYLMQGVKAVQTSGMPHGQPDNKSRVIQFMPRKEFIEQEIVRLVDRIAYVDDVLECMAPFEKSVLLKHYVEGKPFYEIADSESYSLSWLREKIDREIAMAIWRYERQVSDRSKNDL